MIPMQRPSLMAQNETTKIVMLCAHCREEITSMNKYCLDCRLVAGRQERCRNNRKNNQVYRCPMFECTFT